MTPTDGTDPIVEVLQLINQLGPGGAERSLADLAQPLMDRGIRLRVVCLNPLAPEYAGDVNLPCPVDYLHARSLLAKTWELRHRLRQEPPDLVHTTLFESNLVGRLAAAGTKLPVLTSLVNTEYEPARYRDPRVNRLKLTAVRLLESWTARRLTTWFHAITEAVAQSSVRHLALPAERISVIPRGREGARLGKPSPQRRERCRQRLGIAPDTPVLINVGRQEFQKGQAHLLRSLALLRRDHTGVRLLVAGRHGHATAELERLTDELDVRNRVTFLGVRSDVGDLLAAADLFVFPSVYEGLGGAVIEAMALGLPIVASDLPALREAVEPEGNAILVPPADPPALAAAIRALLEDPARAARFGARSRAIFEERFRMDSSAEALAELYRRLNRSGAGR